MSLAGDILKRAGIVPANDQPKPSATSARQVEHSAAQDIPATTVMTARGPMRVTKSGKIDGRSKLRGQPKPQKTPARGPHAFEHIQLRKAFESASPGEQLAWDWRREETYGDLKLRNAQVSYVYKIASIYGHKISVSARPGYILITYHGTNDE